MVEVANLIKRYRGARRNAVDGISFEVAAGQLFCLLGPNGAGKTTAVRVFATLLRPDGGRAQVLGYDVATQAAEVRRRIGLTGQYAALDEYLTGRANLVMIGQLSRLTPGAARRRADEMLERFDLTEAATRAVKTYSGGMRRRLDLAASLVGDPQVLYLDEPTTGLDPRSRNEMWDVVRGLTATGVTVLLTTQYLEEADELADQIAVIDHGLVVAEGTPAELKARTGSQTLAVRAMDPAHTAQVAAVVAGVVGVRPDVAENGLVTAAVSDPAMVPAVVRRLDDAGIVAAELNLRLPSLDEVFLTLTGHRAEDEGLEREGTAA